MRGFVLLLLLSMSCSSCPGDGLNVEGNYGYRRCAFADEPPQGSRSVGELRMVTKGRTLTVEGVGDYVRLAAFSGPAPGRMDPVAAPELRARNIDLALLLGGVGDDDTVASETLDVLGSLPFPTLIVPGGRDSELRLSALHARLPKEAQSKLVLLGSYRRVRLRGHEFVVVAGAEGGRYGIDNTACGFDLSDLQTLARELGPATPKAPRSLWSWTAPGRGGPLGVGRTHQGVDVGSALVAEFSDRIGAKGGLFAWPAVRAASPVNGTGEKSLIEGQEAQDLRMVVPRLGMLPLVRSDGSRVPPGFAVFTLAETGMRLLGRVELQAGPQPKRTEAD